MSSKVRYSYQEVYGIYTRDTIGTVDAFVALSEPIRAKRRERRLVGLGNVGIPLAHLIRQRILVQTIETERRRLERAGCYGN